MRWLPGLALAFVVFVPAASACDLVSEPPGPGHLWVHDHEGAVVTRIDVHDRDLGADCSLDNTIGLTATHYAWRDGGKAHRLDLATLEVTAHDLPHGGQVHLADGGLLQEEMTWDGHTANDTWTLHRWDGTRVELPLPRTWASLVWSDGATALIQDRPSVRANVTTLLYDLSTGTRVAGPFPEHTLAGGRDWHVTNEGLVLTMWRGGQAVGTFHSHEVGYRAPFDPDGFWTLAYGDGDAPPRLLRRSATGATLVDLEVVRGELVAGSATHAVVGDYSPFGPGPDVSLPTIPHPFLGLVPLAAALLARQRR